MDKNPLLELQKNGQSIWLDFLRRGMIESGELQQLIDEDGLYGMTSNPSIFEKSIGGSSDYNEAIETLALEGKSIEEIYQSLTVEDIQNACDLFTPLYDKSEGKHGFVSLEVSPHLAHDTESTIAEAHRLWTAVDRPNVMIKVPATQEGLPAIQQLISEGINVNITLLFGLPRYRKVAEAYIAGLESRIDQKKPVDHINSVASFFLSRIDVLVDPILEQRMKTDEEQAEIAQSLHGQIAVSSAKVAYSIYKEIFNSERFEKLSEHGARTQRLLWASTSTKNPSYSDVKYVEALIGPDTVNTVPLETLNAYRDHGNPARRLEDDLGEARDNLDHLSLVNINLDEVTQQLEDEGVEKFNKPFDRLMGTIREKRDAVLGSTLDHQVLGLNKYKQDVQNRIAELDKESFVPRLWRKDPSLWKKDPQQQDLIRNALGWLHVAEKMEENLGELTSFLDEVKEAGFRHVVHIGMGGSSLAPLVLQRTFTPSADGLPLTVLDTTDPATIVRVEREIPIADTLFIIASKSGTTAEPNALADYFYKWVSAHSIPPIGAHFAAITDPGTPLVDYAKENGFRKIFLNYPDIGGRYSALSYFGLVPAALMGIDVQELLSQALRMIHACSSCVSAGENPGTILGAVLGELAKQGRDKVTFLVSEPIAALGMWLEQLLAESLGKEDTGLLPVAGEPLGEPSVYGDDRIFVQIRLKDTEDDNFERRVANLKNAGHPVVMIQMEDRINIGQEFFRWEIATAAAGSIMDINAFNQPNVQESKDNTNYLLDEVREKGKLEDESPTLVEGSLKLYADISAESITDALSEFLKQARPGDYVDLMAYLTEESEIDQALQDIRVYLRDKLHLPVTSGYGPRFLHSTGQFHKGGPDTGLFIQLTADSRADPQVINEPYTFGVFQRAQALGDLRALREHGRRVLRIHLGADVDRGLVRFIEMLKNAMSNISYQS
jgi:transaldolase/glucose-6-phosphate isomerase